MCINGFYRLLLPFVIAFLLSSCGAFSKVENNPRSNVPSKTSENRLRQSIVEYGKTFEGTDYLYGGKTPKGFDCSGFTAYIFKKYDIQLSGSSKAQSTQGRRIPITKVEAGDLIFYTKNKNGSHINHVSIVVSNTSEGITVIHSTSRGVVIDNISKSSYWKPRILFARSVAK